MFSLFFSEIIDGEDYAELTVGSFKTLEELKEEEYPNFLRFFGIEPEEQKVVGSNYHKGTVLTKEQIFQILMDHNFLVKRGFLAKIRARLQLRKFLKKSYPVPGFDSFRYVFRPLPKDKDTGISYYQLTSEFFC